MLQYSVQSMDQVRMMTGTSPFAHFPGLTGKDGISTSVSVLEASKYATNFKTFAASGCKYVYLIDAMGMAGFVVPDKQGPFLTENSEICFLSSIPNTSVVGVVCSDGPYLIFNSLTLSCLNLAVNPEYWSGCEKGLAAAKKVVELFNT
ncbi:hypothetical protein [Endozoicomonas euniceicola]|uniref:Uncharacterized protein n=1 Tax=Endozoicomonas euniceicola TaxID=1234143 RepID=A0ABY6H070_9GAMM|nr:hypothetical protein [Endozoicomonas euniceicola]UYM18432.1 hypothetical protein NX720_11190 [Endozoicomonas euniceicola]